MTTEINFNANFYILIALLCVVILSYIIVNFRMNKLSEKVIKLQKTILYQQNILEKQNKILSTLKTTKTADDDDIIRPEELEIQNDIMIMDEESKQNIRSITPATSIQPYVQQNSVHEQQPAKQPPNPINSILPLINTVMTMVNSTSSDSQNSVQPEQDLEPTIEQKEELKKEENKMIEDIKDELNELNIDRNKLEVEVSQSANEIKET